MLLQDILAVKGSVVHSLGPEVRLDEAARTMVEHKIGALLICRTGASGQREMLGIVTERDILYHCARSNLPLSAVPVSEVMTTKLITAAPTDAVEQILGLMTDRRIRHTPVLDEGKLAGIVSIGDLVKAQHDRLALENRFMKGYIQGET
ncbi:MAG: CBS domain-containing protein [Pirellulales bacterium]|nr:CBS domain-containing protein [Pirellulales bacterium]